MDDPTQQAVAQLIRGELQYTHDRHEEAEHTLLKARAMLPPAAGLRIRASVAETLGNLYATRWEPDQALPYYDEALARHEQRVGSDHHDLLRALNGRAVSLIQLQRYDEATAAFGRALAIATAGGSLTAGPVAQLTTNLGALHEQRGQLLKALSLYRDGMSRSEALLGPHHEETLTNLFNVANVLEKLERYEPALAAVQEFQQRIAGRESVAHGLSTRMLRVEMESHRALGHLERAIAAQQRRLDLWREQPPADLDLDDIAEGEATLAELRALAQGTVASGSALE